MPENPITVYTLEGCGKCVVFKKKLKEMGVDYVEKNCTANPGVARVLKLHAFPSIEVNGEILAYNSAVAWLREQDL
jgi:glutaredoxin